MCIAGTGTGHDHLERAGPLSRAAQQRPPIGHRCVFVLVFLFEGVPDLGGKVSLVL